MFVRKKKNRTGTISVVVVDKSKGRFKEIKNFGVVSSAREAEALCANARAWISRYGGQQILDFDKEHMQERKVEETKKNITLLQRGRNKYILDMRVRNEAKTGREWILS